MDPVKQVRTRFIAKLHKGLARGVPYKCLPLDFMGFYAIVGMELDKSVKDVTKRYMVSDILARKDCIKQMSYNSSKALCINDLPEKKIFLCCTMYKFFGHKSSRKKIIMMYQIHLEKEFKSLEYSLS